MMRIDYRDPRHAELPHVVKFSGGRSSGMLLFTLLKSRQLDADRGDVVIFNNTAAEHPETYRFVNECRRRVRPTRVPFFQIEFQTYEDAHHGEWTRRPTYRLVNTRPRTAANEDGFHWRGEVYEELLSWSGYVPNQFRRTCTKHLKLEPTRRFVQDWTTGTPGINRLGHHHDRPRVDPAARFRIHREHNGRVPEAIYLRKHAYCWSRPHVRPKQRYADFSPDWKPWRTKRTGLPEKQEHVTIIGLRGDEGRRIARVRNRGGHDTEHAGENIYMPLDDWAIAQKDVNAFWEKREWDLNLPPDAGLSNCVYCFLKGGSTLSTVHDRMQIDSKASLAGFGKLAGTPSDLAWWRRMENDYGRDLVAENCQKNERVERIGFFGARPLSYGDLDTGNAQALPGPCDCME